MMYCDFSGPMPPWRWRKQIFLARNMFGNGEVGAAGTVGADTDCSENPVLLDAAFTRD